MLKNILTSLPNIQNIFGISWRFIRHVYLLVLCKVSWEVKARLQRKLGYQVPQERERKKFVAHVNGKCHTLKVFNEIREHFNPI